MRRIFGNGCKVLLSGILPGSQSGHDVVSKGTKTFESYLLEDQNWKETGWDRLKQMFEIDEFGNMSSELNSVYQASFCGFFAGFVFGGISYSREAYLNFMENNEATAFQSHLDAKRKLQNDFMVSFARGGIKWGWRIGLFTTSYYGIITAISVYREQSSIYEYLAAGFTTGAVYRMHMGLRGMAAGGVIGGVLAGIAGGVTLLILHASGITMKDLRYWQYKWHLNRNAEIHNTYKRLYEEEYPTSPLIKEHDKEVGEASNLEEVK